MTTNPITGTAGAASAQASAQTSKPKDVADALTSTDTFLTLLVAQLKNQDPLNPADGTAFVTQLATFSGVEQSTQMRDDLDAIKAAVTAVPPASSTTSTNDTNNTTGTTNS